MDRPPLEIHVHVHGWEAALRRIERKLDLVLAAQGVELSRQEELLMDLNALASEVEQNGAAVDSAVALLSGLSQMLRDQAGDPAAVQALADQIDANTQRLAAAVTANTPAAPAPAEPAPGEPAPAPAEAPPAEPAAPEVPPQG